LLPLYYRLSSFRRSRSGSLAKFAAMRRASSLLQRLPILDLGESGSAGTTTEKQQHNREGAEHADREA